MIEYLGIKQCARCERILFSYGRDSKGDLCTETLSLYNMIFPESYFSEISENLVCDFCLANEPSSKHLEEIIYKTNSTRKLISIAHITALRKGWHDNPRSPCDYAMLFRSELMEAFEVWRKDLPRHRFLEEISDALIRHFDWCALNNRPLEVSFTEREYKSAKFLDNIPKALFYADYFMTRIIAGYTSQQSENDKHALEYLIELCRRHYSEYNLLNVLKGTMGSNLYRPHRHGGRRI
jgi:hypothetical protein